MQYWLSSALRLCIRVGPCVSWRLWLQINADPLSQIAAKNWSAAVLASGKGCPAFDKELVQRIYDDELGGRAGRQPQLRRVMLLEISQYLENYLWPNFDGETSSAAHVISIMLIINEKFRENVSAWACFASRPVCTLPSAQGAHGHRGREWAQMSRLGRVVTLCVLLIRAGLVCTGLAAAPCALDAAQDAVCCQYCRRR